VALFSASEVKAQTMTTAFLTGEQTTGMTKQCYYEALGNRYTRTVSSTALCALSIRVPISPGGPSESPRTPETITAFLTGEQTTGNTKQCYYEALGSRYTQTVSSIALCPLSTQVRRRP
jgi:O-acetyl-ADP-ribose deacetylase (regulator of RNase III)